MKKLEDVLQPGEEVLWKGIPEPGIHLRREDAVLIPFSILWFAFALFMILSMRENGPLGVILILVGLHLLFGRFVLSAQWAAHTVYAVTNQRVMILTRCRQKDIDLERVSRVRLRRHRNGLGTVFFDQPRVFLSANRLGYYMFFGGDNRFAFRNILYWDVVDDLIQKQLNH